MKYQKRNLFKGYNAVEHKHLKGSEVLKYFCN